MQESWILLSEQQRTALEPFTSPPGWQVISQSGLPSVFPEALRAKVHSAIAITAPTSTGGTYLVFSALRPDLNDQAVDIEPFGLIVDSSGPSSSGAFLHHGEWQGRSQPAPDAFWQTVISEGIGDYFFTNPPAGRTSGSLDELPIEHAGAFKNVVKALRARRNRHRTGDA